jgi:hypothetical protein
MQVTENNQNIEEISVPITACPIEDVLDYTIKVAEYIIDVRDIHDYFKNKDVFTRQDVKEWMKNNNLKIGEEYCRSELLDYHGLYSDFGSNQWKVFDLIEST